MALLSQGDRTRFQHNSDKIGMAWSFKTKWTEHYHFNDNQCCTIGGKLICDIYWTGVDERLSVILVLRRCMKLILKTFQLLYNSLVMERLTNNKLLHRIKFLEQKFLTILCVEYENNVYVYRFEKCNWHFNVCWRLTSKVFA